MKRIIAFTLLSLLSWTQLLGQEPDNKEKKADEEDKPAVSEGDAAPKTEALFLIYSDKEGRYIRPILQIAGGVTHWESATRKKTSIAKQTFRTTTAITRFGFQGKASKHISFHSEFERNLGVNATSEIGGGEVIGTGVWEGTAAFSVRDNYVKASAYGLSVSAGIVTDPASADFFSVHTADLLLADPAVRDPLLFSGYNRAQGILAQYNFKKLIGQDLDIGFMYNAGNPLSTSSALSFGGQVSSVDGVFTNAIRNKGQSQLPGDQVTMETMSPGIVYKVWIFETRLAAQLHQVNSDRFTDNDVTLSGQNLRGALAMKIFKNTFVPYGNYSETENDTVFIGSNGNFGPTEFNPGLKGEKFKTQTWSAGLDINFGRWIGWDKRDGIGASYAHFRHEKYKNFENEIEYMNAGLTKWLSTHASVGMRFSAVLWKQKRVGKLFDEVDTTAGFLTMRLLL